MEVRTLLLNLGSADSTVRAGGSWGLFSTHVSNIFNAVARKCYLAIIEWLVVARPLGVRDH